MSKDNGGPAFPVTLAAGQNYGGHAPFDGMTLRDYFAAKAMQACPSKMNSHVGVGYEANNINLCMASYAIADAMLKERAK